MIVYSNLKKSLEKDFFDNRNDYSLGKNTFVEKNIENAEQEKTRI